MCIVVFIVFVHRNRLVTLLLIDKEGTEGSLFEADIDILDEQDEQTIHISAYLQTNWIRQNMHTCRQDE